MLSRKASRGAAPCSRRSRKRTASGRESFESKTLTASASRSHPPPEDQAAAAPIVHLMPISDYVRELRECVGTRLLLLPGVTGIVRDEQGRVLLMRRADNGFWGFPAGAIDPGETPAQAVEREVREETGLHVRATRVAGVFGGAGFRLRYENGDEAEY